MIENLDLRAADLWLAEKGFSCFSAKLAKLRTKWISRLQYIIYECILLHVILAHKLC